jgi:hypothetical protein
MADLKISQLTGATTPLAGTEVLPIVQASTTKKVSVADLTAGRETSATKFIPTGGSATGNGMYLPAANTLAWSVNGAEAYRVSSDSTFRVKGAGTAGSTDAIQFSGSAPASSLLVDSSGRTLIGAASFTANSANFDAGSAFVKSNLFFDNTAGTGNYNVRLDGYGNTLYIVWANGTTDSNNISYAYGGTAWVNSSDETLKDIIEPITNAVDKVCKLRSVIGKYKTEADGVRHPFLIAQDVQSVLPEAVYVNKARKENEIDTLGVGYTDLIPLLVAAIKEQQAMIDQLKSKLA